MVSSFFYVYNLKCYWILKKFSHILEKKISRKYRWYHFKTKNQTQIFRKYGEEGKDQNNVFKPNGSLLLIMFKCLCGLQKQQVYCRTKNINYKRMSYNNLYFLKCQNSLWSSVSKGHLIFVLYIFYLFFTLASLYFWW